MFELVNVFDRIDNIPITTAITVPNSEMEHLLTRIDLYTHGYQMCITETCKFKYATEGRSIESMILDNQKMILQDIDKLNPPIRGSLIYSMTHIKLSPEETY